MLSLGSLACGLESEFYNDPAWMYYVVMKAESFNMLETKAFFVSYLPFEQTSGKVPSKIVHVEKEYRTPFFEKAASLLGLADRTLMGNVGIYPVLGRKADGGFRRTIGKSVYLIFEDVRVSRGFARIERVPKTPSGELLLG